MRSLPDLTEGRPRGKNPASQHCCGVTSHAFTQKISITSPGGEGRGAGTPMCSCVHPTVPFNDLSSRVRERRTRDSVLPQPVSFQRASPSGSMSQSGEGCLVFEETDFIYKLDPKHKPTAYLMLRKTAIRSNSAGKTGCVGLPGGAFQGDSWGDFESL